MPSLTPHYVILGAGISGLSLAWFLRKLYNDTIKITLIEKTSRAGGWVRTVQTQDFLFETGPRSCRSSGNGLFTLQLIEELGLADHYLAASNASKKRFIYTDGKLECLPTNPFAFFTSPLMKGMLPILWREWNISASQESDESIHDFISRRLSIHIADHLFDPLTTGIYAGDIHKLSMEACFPAIWNMEQADGSLVKGVLKKAFKKKDASTFSPFIQKGRQSSIFTLKNGMQSLVDTLSEKLKDILLLDCEATELKFNSQDIEISTSKNTVLHANKLFCTLSLNHLNPLLAPYIPDRPKHENASVIVMNLGWKEKVLTQEGFGYLIPSKEKEDVLGVVWDSSAFPDQNSQNGKTRLTVMLGGSHRPDILSMNDIQIERIVLKTLQKQIGLTKTPEVMLISRAVEAIPQYYVGHNNRVKTFKKQIQELSNGRMHILGCSWNGVAVNDCIAMSKKMALEMS